MASEDGSNGLQNGFCWTDEVAKSRKSENFVLIQSQILSVVVRPSHYNYLGGAHFQVI